MWWMLFPRWIWFLMCMSMEHQVPGATSSALNFSHPGICPNDMNPNLWVDAMSTCTRECDSDQVCETFEKCCPNVCGDRSCVAARYMDVNGKTGPVGMPKEATCANFMCNQQGSECEIWDGQPVCKCRDRCEREPHFTCASDGMTYYNKCYMDAEACSKGTSLAVVVCRAHFAWPHTSPSLPIETTVRPTTAPLQATSSTPTGPYPPAIASIPSRQVVAVGDTASFLCEVTGQPQPEVSWEKQEVQGQEHVIMRPNHVRGNVVVTNIGQLVIYNAQTRDTGVYTCTARNPSGSAQAHHPLTVLLEEPLRSFEPRKRSHCSAEECLRPPNSEEDCGTDERVSWYYEPKRNSCLSVTHCSSSSSPWKAFETSEACMQCCGPEVSVPCGLASLQGPCKAYKPRWAYSLSLQQCQSFVYGGCGGNDNNFESKEACEATCPFPKHHHCKACKPRGKMVTSFCKSDFVILGRLSGLTEGKDSGQALVSVEEILKDEKMGLRFFGQEPLEVTFVNMNWNCPCPNITGAASGGQVIVMGDVKDGMAVLHRESYLGASTPRRVWKLREVVSKNTCDILQAMSSTQ